YREMMIVFIYDTARCCKEEDDPAEAVIYFHPAWVSLTQRLALAGQLMGINQFLTTSFSAPHSISLQGGKFILKKFGQFILAVGTDRNIQDWILERRASTLESILKFFHCDFKKILESFNNDRNRFMEKLYQMFETYLPVLQYSANLFSNIPIMKLPKSASNVFLESIHLLQYYQETNGIMGGALFYNNKVIATQLSSELTKQIVITDPYRIKAPAEKISTEFHLPLGVQLLQVYIDQKQFDDLKREASEARYHSCYLESVAKKLIQRKNTTKSTVRDTPLSGMKRDTSRIFTVPEERELDSIRYIDNVYHISSKPLSINNSPKRKQEVKVERTKYYNTQVPSVCSTPLKDINRILHDTAVLICNTNEEIDNFAIEGKSPEIKVNDDIPDVVKEALRCKRLNKLRNATGNKEDKRISWKDTNKRSLSLPDLDTSIRKHASSIHLRAYSLGLPKLTKNLSIDYKGESPEGPFSPNKRRFYNTITDPFYPIFHRDGFPISQSLYEHYISTHYQEMESQCNKVTRDPSDLIKNQPVSFSPKIDSSVNDLGIKGKSQKLEMKASFSCNAKLDNKSKQESYRRSMSLPLKPLNMMETIDDKRKSTTESGQSTCDLLQKRKLDGLQLTPLMSKLSLLVDEYTSGFCSKETTPSEFREIQPGFPSSTSQIIKQKLEAVEKEPSIDQKDELKENLGISSQNENLLQKVELFLCGHQNMVLILLMEDGTANNPDLIHNLWKTCIGTLGKLEARLQQSLDPLPSNESKKLYSILHIDPDWDTMQRTGLWGVTELDIASCLHDRFMCSSNLTDIIVRTEDAVVYGNQCGKVQVFYQQAAEANTPGGLPTPADLMGVISLKAKRRLVRDHGIFLL
ncbi:uncharacterized protein HPS4, partial [Prorops nasuta]|uniref:uncharacterized protein HPS4 n=1 Tax=Prorops nasuta TaxID=863751 RepID=UPI0034CFAD99